jgi:hypothetical protein
MNGLSITVDDTVIGDSDCAGAVFAMSDVDPAIRTNLIH